MRILICLLFILFSSNSYAQDVPLPVPEITELTDLCNQVLKGIYEDVLSVKDQYGELKNFTKASVTKNNYGITQLEYNAQNSGEHSYRFGVTIVKIDDPNPFRSDETAFDYGFPLLGIKIAGFQNRLKHRDRFDVLNPIQQYGQQLLDEQRKYTPLLLTAHPVNETVKVGENIEFIISLKNQSAVNLAVKPLNTQTVIFIYDGVLWGAREKDAKKAETKEIILGPGDEIARKFIGSSFPKARGLEVYCSYIKTYKGIALYDLLKINIIE